MSDDDAEGFCLTIREGDQVTITRTEDGLPGVISIYTVTGVRANEPGASVVGALAIERTK